MPTLMCRQCGELTKESHLNVESGVAHCRSCGLLYPVTVGGPLSAEAPRGTSGRGVRIREGQDRVEVSAWLVRVWPLTWLGVAACIAVAIGFCWSIRGVSPSVRGVAQLSVAVLLGSLAFGIASYRAMIRVAGAAVTVWRGPLGSGWAIEEMSVNTTHCRRWLRLAVLLPLVGGAGCGCRGTTKASGSGPTFEANHMGTMVVGVQRFDATQGYSTQWYILERSDSVQFAQALYDNTETSGSPDQYIGGEVRVLAVDGQDGQLCRFYVDTQYVEGMGDKRNPSPNSHLLQQVQRERRATVVNLVEQRGRRLSMDESDQYAKQFQDAEYEFLFWRN